MSWFILNLASLIKSKFTLLSRYYQILSLIFNFCLLCKKAQEDSSKYYNLTTYKLKRELFFGYDSWVRPVKNFNTTTKIKLSLSLTQLLNVVSKNY